MKPGYRASRMDNVLTTRSWKFPWNPAGQLQDLRWKGQQHRTLWSSQSQKQWKLGASHWFQRSQRDEAQSAQSNWLLVSLIVLHDSGAAALLHSPWEKFKNKSTPTKPNLSRDQESIVSFLTTYESRILDSPSLLKRVLSGKGREREIGERGLNILIKVHRCLEREPHPTYIRLTPDFSV
jgi:hypothetical protein